VLSDVLVKLGSKKQLLQEDLTKLENQIYPRYQQMAAGVKTEMSELDKKYGDLSTAADQQGDVWHRQITAIVNKRKSQIEERKIKHRDILQKQSDKISHKITELKQTILEIKNFLDSNDISLASTYQSRYEEFKKMPDKIIVTLPCLSIPKLNTEKLNEIFASVSELSVSTVRPLLDEPRVTATIDTGYKVGLRGVSCVGEDLVWTRGSDKTMKLFNLRGDLLTSIQTNSGKSPTDIAVTKEGDLVYADYWNRTVNIMNRSLTVITLQVWEPHGVCCTQSGELLVTMYRNNYKESKVVRYSGSTETQTIQYNDQGWPLYLLPGNISENRNLDICVSDDIAVVVVNASGKLRFRYTGHPSNTGGSFDPHGIATNSQGHILVADRTNNRVHIIDQDGQFLRYIRCDLLSPIGLCVDIRDNLFVAESGTDKCAKVKRIQYL
jgi:DNA-binding beta-propeller fold protein YncE